MPRKKMLELPAQASKDINSVKGILDRWSVGVEDVLKDVFGWVKKHKMLVLVVIGLIAMKRYWLDEPVEEEEEE